MKHEMKETLWKFTCVVRSFQSETHSLYTCISMPVLVTCNWEHLKLWSHLCLSFFNSYGLFH